MPVKGSSRRKIQRFRLDFCRDNRPARDAHSASCFDGSRKLTRYENILR
jgi:hypothetical protein